MPENFEEKIANQAKILKETLAQHESIKTFIESGILDFRYLTEKTASQDFDHGNFDALIYNYANQLEIIVNSGSKIIDLARDEKISIETLISYRNPNYSKDTIKLAENDNIFELAKIGEFQIEKFVFFKCDSTSVDAAILLADNKNIFERTAIFGPNNEKRFSISNFCTQRTFGTRAAANRAIRLVGDENFMNLVDRGNVIDDAHQTFENPSSANLQKILEEFCFDEVATKVMLDAAKNAVQRNEPLSLSQVRNAINQQLTRGENAQTGVSLNSASITNARTERVRSTQNHTQ